MSLPLASGGRQAPLFIPAASDPDKFPYQLKARLQPSTRREKAYPGGPQRHLKFVVNDDRIDQIRPLLQPSP